MEGVVETTDYAAAVGITVADVNRLHLRCLGYEILFKNKVEYRNGGAICRGIWGVYEDPATRAEKGGG